MSDFDPTPDAGAGEFPTDDVSASELPDDDVTTDDVTPDESAPTAESAGEPAADTPAAVEFPAEMAATLASSDADNRRAIEAVILVAQDPVAPELLAQLLERSVLDVERWCGELAAAYEQDRRGFELVRIAGGYRMQTHSDLTPYVERFLLHDQRARLSGAALETLAIVAYKQPISRAQVASIRGVDPDGVLRTLQGRGYIDVVGHDSGPGQAVLYGTTTTFLEKLGLDSIDDLPPIAEFIPGADVVEALEAGLRVTDVPPS